MTSAAKSGIPMVHSDDLVAHISAQRSSGRAAKSRRLVVAALSTCLVASAGLFAARSGGGGGGGLAQSVVREGPPPGYMDPVQYMDSQAHSRFVRDTKTAEDMYTHNYKVNVPCSWGIKCQLHVRPTLRERTGGAWLGEGPVTPLAKVRTERLTGPWEQKFAKNLPQPAGNGWGNVDRAIGAPYLRANVANAKRVKEVSAPTKAYYADPHDEMVLGQRTPSHALASLHYETPGAGRPSQQPQADTKEDKEEAKLEKQAAAIKAKMAKSVSDYGSAAIETANGYHP